jgi:cytochrome c oxidase assembly protein subunit 15
MANIAVLHAYDAQRDAFPVPPMTPSERRAVALWLLLCAAMVFVIVVVGGVTRLTRSGLSIVEWQPL